jgi:hypothetical protein
LRNGQNFHSVNHEWSVALKEREMSKNLSLNFHLTVLLQVETQENVLKLSAQDQEAVKEIMPQLRNDRNLLHDILFRERLEDLTETIREECSLAKSIVLPVGTAT